MLEDITIVDDWDRNSGLRDGSDLCGRVEWEKEDHEKCSLFLSVSLRFSSFLSVSLSLSLSLPPPPIAQGGGLSLRVGGRGL